jgi:hypothetical protein
MYKVIQALPATGHFNASRSSASAPGSAVNLNGAVVGVLAAVADHDRAASTTASSAAAGTAGSTRRRSIRLSYAAITASATGQAVATYNPAGTNGYVSLGNNNQTTASYAVAATRTRRPIRRRTGGGAASSAAATASMGTRPSGCTVIAIKSNPAAASASTTEVRSSTTSKAAT